MKKVLTVIGTRPQYIKSCLVSKELKKTNYFKEVIIDTGQHYDYEMSRVFLKELKLTKPKYNLGINNSNHSIMTSKMMKSLDQIFNIEKPDLCLVYGDTNSTLSAALVAAKRGVLLAHIEAGLRSFNRQMPEEINRIVTDHVSNIFFTPSRSAEKNLVSEGVNKSQIFNVGDVMYDNILYFKKKLSKTPKEKKRKILVTIHRQENSSKEKILKIIKFLKKISTNSIILWPVHPRLQKILSKISIAAKNIHFLKPLSYFEFLQNLNNSDLFITDSGGAQKESYFLNTKCLVLRNETEWVELIKTGRLRLFNDKELKEYNKYSIEMLMKKFSNKSKTSNLYGNGDAHKKIVRILKNFLY